MQHTIRLIALAAVATLAASGAVQAQDSTLKGGVIYYQTHARTNGVTPSSFSRCSTMASSHLRQLSARP